MSFAVSDVELRALWVDLIHKKADFCGVMESGVRRRSSVEGKKIRDYSRQVSQVNRRKPLSLSYFSLESLLVLVCLTASLLILPVILPPLPPPPFMLLLLPIGILVVLLVLAFMPSDVRDVASWYM